MRTRTGKRQLALAALAAGLSLLAAACGGSSTPGVAHVGTTTSAAGTTASASGSAGAGLEAFSACMRAHGLANFPDPNAQGNIQVTPAMGLDKGSGQFRRAQAACGNLAPAGEPASHTPQQIRGFLDFAKCMRKHGVPSFPDPTAQGELTTEMLNAAGIDVHSAAVQAAAATCVSASHGVVTPAMVKRAEEKAGA